LASPKKNAQREGRLIVFVDESGISERPTRVRTWAPKGQTPVIQFHFNWNHVSVIAGLTRMNCLFRLYEGSIKKEEIVDFLKAIKAHLKQALLVRVMTARNRLGIAVRTTQAYAAISRCRYLLIGAPLIQVKLSRIACWVYLAGFVVAGHAQCSPLVLTADPDYPPMHWYDGKTLQGASIAIAKRVLEDLSIPYEVRYLGPFPRVVDAAKRGDVDMVATLKRTPEREEFLLFPKTPALANPVAAFVARSRKIEFKSRADLVGLHGGMTRGNVFGDGLDEFMKQSLTVEVANSPENNFSKLGVGRIDYFVTGLYVGMAYLLQRGEESRFVALSPFLVDTPNFVVLTRKGHCADKLQAIDARLATLQKNGVLKDLVRQSFDQWKAHPVVVK